MVNGVNSSNLAYSPVSYSPVVNRPFAEKELQSPSAHPVNYSQSIVDNARNQSDPTHVQGSSDFSSQSNRDSVREQEQVQQVITQLKARDSEVRAHEMAHLAAAGMYATAGMSFSYQRGPDGR